MSKIVKRFLESLEEPNQMVCKSEEPITAKIIKNDNEDKRLFYSVVIEPMTQVTESGDSHGDNMTAEEVEKSAHYYMEMGSTIFKNHNGKIDARVVESYIAPVDFTPEGSSEVIKKGSWVMAVKVLDDATWQEIKKGEITAFSPGGYGYRVDL